MRLSPTVQLERKARSRIPRRSEQGVEDGDDGASPLGGEFAAIDAALARSEAAVEQAKMPGPARARERDPLVYELDWDEDEQLQDSRAVLRQAGICRRCCR